MTNALALYVTDVDGAPEFKRQAEAFATMYSCDVIHFKPWDWRGVETALTAYQGRDLELIAFFCHGFRSRLMTGHCSDWRAKLPKFRDVEALAHVIADAAQPYVKVLIDACSTGSDSVGVDGDGGFADTLRDRLGMHACNGGWIDAHNTAGRSAENPYVRRFYTDGDPAPSPGLGGSYIVAPREKPLWPLWKTAVETDFRFRFPLMTTDQIRGYLAQRKQA